MAGIVGNALNRLWALRRGGKAQFVWALADQAIVSLGNFGLGITLARFMDSRQYGIYAFVMSVLMLLNTLHQALVTYPLSVDGAVAASAKLRRLTGIALELTLLVNIPFALIVFGSALTVDAPLVGLLAVPALLLWQVQEVFRRVRMAQMAHHGSIATDTVRYFGLWACAIAAGLWFRLSAEIVFAMSVGASILGAFVGTLGLPPARIVPTHELADKARRNWESAHLVFWSSLVALFSVQALLWAVTWLKGVEAAGAFQAVVNIAAIASPLMYGIDNLLVPKLSKERRSLDRTQFRRRVARYTGAALLVTAIPFAVAWIAPAELIRLLYGRHTPYAVYTAGLRWLVLTYVLFVATAVFAAVLKGTRRNKGLLDMQIYSAAVGATLGIWLVWKFGITGACAASALVGGVRALVAGIHVLKIQTSDLSG